MNDTIKKWWLEELKEFPEDGVELHSKPLSFIEIVNFNNLIGDTLEELGVNEKNLIPWLSSFMPAYKKEESFFAHIERIMETKEYRALQTQEQHERKSEK